MPSLDRPSLRHPFRVALVQARAAAQTTSTDGLLLLRQPAHRELLGRLAVDVTGLEALGADLGLVGDVLRRHVGSEVATGLTDLGADVAVAPPPWPSATALVTALGPELLTDVDPAAVRGSDPWLRPLEGDLAPELLAVREALSRTAAARASSAALATARGLALRTATLVVAGRLLGAAVAEVARSGDLTAGLVAQLWVRRRVLRDPADGEGHRGFAHLVDGERL